jgi:predicted ester cyclase
MTDRQSPFANSLFPFVASNLAPHRNPVTCILAGLDRPLAVCTRDAMDGRPPNARNKANYIAAKAAYNARELDQCLAFYAREHQIMSRPAPLGREHIRAFLEGTLAAWPDLRLEVAQVVAEDDWVMGRCVATATHTTAVMGVAPTGKQVVTTFWDLHRFDDAGLIVQTWNLMDSLALMHQLGLLPSS